MSKVRHLVAVVDDDESVRKALQRLLRCAGLDVDTYRSGDDFLAAFPARQHDCLILDLHMPGLNCFEVQARLRAAAAHVPVVVITGQDTDEARKRVLEAGAYSYLGKPLDYKILLEAVADAVAGRAETKAKL